METAHPPEGEIEVGKFDIGRHHAGRIAERIVANELEARGFRVSDVNRRKAIGTRRTATGLGMTSKNGMRLGASRGRSKQRPYE